VADPGDRPPDGTSRGQSSEARSAEARSGEAPSGEARPSDAPSPDGQAPEKAHVIIESAPADQLEATVTVTELPADD
jgi:hypothetical protein